MRTLALHVPSTPDSGEYVTIYVNDRPFTVLGEDLRQPLDQRAPPSRKINTLCATKYGNSNYTIGRSVARTSTTAPKSTGHQGIEDGRFSVGRPYSAN